VSPLILKYFSKKEGLLTTDVELLLEAARKEELQEEGWGFLPPIKNK